MILFAIINLTFLFDLSNCQYEYDYVQSDDGVAVSDPDYIADTTDYLYDYAPEVDSGSRLQAARRIYFRPKGITSLNT